MISVLALGGAIAWGVSAWRFHSQEPTSNVSSGVTHRIRAWERAEGFPAELAVFETVFWEPRDTTSLRELIGTTELVKGKTVLEIGTGSGLVSLCCLAAGAEKVVATDVNPAAVENARYNAERLGLSDRFEVRLVSLDDKSAYAVIGADEKFDLIISNPPWENDTPKSIDEYALYDTSFALLHTLLRDLPAHLKPGGKALLAYGCRTAIRELRRLAAELGYMVTIFDERDPETLPEVFLPGMLLEVVPGE